MRRLLTAVVLVAAAASSSGAAAGGGIGLSASPLRVTLRGASAAVITVRNPGGRGLRVDVSRARFVRSLQGKPGVRPARGAAAWLRVRPRRFRIAPGAKRTLRVVAAPRRRVAPGDHPAVVILTTRPLGGRRVRLRLQVGVIVVLRARGRIVRHLEARSLRVHDAGEAQLLELLLVNRGNVTERLADDKLRLVLLRKGRVFARLRPRGREILPRSAGLAEFSYRGGVRGKVVARLEMRRIVGGARRSFQIRF